MRLSAVLAGMALFVLAGCSLRIDEMRIRINRDQSGQLNASGSTTLDDESQSDLENSSDFKAARRVEDKLSNCGLETKIYTRGEKLILDTRTSFASPDDLQSILRCVPTSWEGASIITTRYTGILWDTYTTNVFIRQKVFIPSKQPNNITLQSLDQFPAKLYVYVPGEIDKIENQSKILGAAVDIVKNDINSALVTVSLDPSKRDSRNKFERERALQIKSGRTTLEAATAKEDLVSVRIQSSENKYSLENILSLFGIIFGSGLLIELTRRVFRVRIESRPPDPTH